MRKLIVSNLMSLDGFFAGPTGEIDWFVTGEDFFEKTTELVERTDTMLFGRVTYEGMRDFWTSEAGLAVDPAIAAQMNTTPKVVLSRTLERVTWGQWDNARLLRGELGAAVTALKQEPGKDIIIYGSGQIVAQLTELGLIDEYWMFINPLLLGGGKPEWTGLTHRLPLKLLGTKIFQSGTVGLIYAPA